MKANAIQSNITYNQNTQANILDRLIAWSTRGEYARIYLLTAMLMIHGCITVPFALLSFYFVGGGGLFQVSVITVSSFALLVVNLAALPTKVTIPTFLVSTLLIVLTVFLNMVVQL